MVAHLELVDYSRYFRYSCNWLHVVEDHMMCYFTHRVVVVVAIYVRWGAARLSMTAHVPHAEIPEARQTIILITELC